MLKLKQVACAAVTWILASMAVTNAANPAARPSVYGALVADATPSRVVTITADTKWAKVTDGETVRFIVGDQAFTWHFVTYPNLSSFELKEIAPPDVQVGAVRVYIAPNPLYSE